VGLRTVINNQFKKFIWLLVLPATISGVNAEVAYVTDRLQLSVHQAEDTSDRAFASLKSADRVEILDQNMFYARVRMPDGREGWVRKTYLVNAPPALLRVALVEKERDEMAAELKALQGRLEQERSRSSSLEKKVASSDAETKSEQDELVELRATSGELQERLDAYRFSVTGTWFLIVTGVCLVVGVVSSWWWIDRRSRMRHGGFRLY